MPGFQATVASNLALAALLVITLAGLIGWLYRRGKISAGYRTANDELEKIGKINKESQRIDETTHKKVDRITDTRGAGSRRFWMRDD